ncbi:hypothetical protein GYMLUDRAFT_584969 [Collybiopsis luxurians FD-317 M1]|uniref:Uncharacterized protein n=1 Tax=Collybiopsis luxurians FD-317 M1 TaxID=944289 RepID=A0A0D0BWC8_9AGAR|nr:hypothetical protein GYMLUDRAFT_584969 [Collybiopsis luxurians FD-317 M1]
MTAPTWPQHASLYCHIQHSNLLYATDLCNPLALYLLVSIPTMKPLKRRLSKSFRARRSRQAKFWFISYETFSIHRSPLSTRTTIASCPPDGPQTANPNTRSNKAAPYTFAYES